MVKEKKTDKVKEREKEKDKDEAKRKEKRRIVAQRRKDRKNEKKKEKQEKAKKKAKLQHEKDKEKAKDTKEDKKPEAGDAKPKAAEPTVKPTTVARIIPEDPEPEIASMPVAIFNIINFLYCPLLTTMPLGVVYAGPYFACPALIVVVLTVFFSNHINARVARVVKATHYQGIVHILAPKNRPLFFFVSFLELCKNFLVVCMLNIILSDTSTKFLVVVNPEWTLTRKFRLYVIVIISCVFIFPLSVLKKTTRIAKLAMVSMIFMSVSLLLMIFRLYWREESMYRRILKMWSWKIPELSQYAAIVLGILSTHRCCFVVYVSLKKHSIKRWNYTLIISYSLVGALMLAFGYVGFATFFNYVQGNIFENYCIFDSLMLTARCTFAIAVFCFIPVNISYARSAMKRLFVLKELSMINFYLMTLIFVLISLMISLSSRCVGPIMLYYGSTVATFLIYILPGWFYLKISPPGIVSVHKLGAMFLMCLGCFFVLYGTIIISLSIHELWAFCSQGHEMHYCVYDDVL